MPKVRDARRCLELVSSFPDLDRHVRFGVTNHSADHATCPKRTMEVDFSETSCRGDTLLATIHGFRVQPYGNRLSSGFKRGLKRLAERGFDDPTCVVVKTTSGSRSGITHAGGRYVDPENPYRTEVMRQMRELGMEPPPLPFVLAPGECMLYHEWGHHVDRSWSGEDWDVSFSFRWFSRFYNLFVRPPRIARGDRGCAVDDDIRPIESDLDAANVVGPWLHASSELFANLFEDWMRDEKTVDWDQCEPQRLNVSEASAGYPFMRIALLGGVRAEDVRADTYSLFAAGIRSAAQLPPLRPGLFGPSTDKVIGQLRKFLAGARAGRF